MSKESLEMGVGDESIDPTEERHVSEATNDEGYDFGITEEALGDKSFDQN